MASKVKLVESQATPTADSTQRLSTKTRFGVSAILGGAVVLGAGAAAAQYGVVGGIAAVAAAVKTFLETNVTQVQIVNVADQLNTLLGGQGTQVALGAAALATGAAIGGAIGKVTAYKASLNDVKARLGVEGSDLNFSQIHRIADVAVKGGIFSGRSIALQFKEDAVRISNLNRELTNTEFSLSSNAHNTSKARGTEDRFFDLEGGRLASQSASSDDFVASLKSLKSAVNAEVKATDKYTFQKGNSSTAISRREYILTGIISFAYQRGIAGNFLTAAIKERAETAKSNPKLADVNFRKALQKGIAAGILAPHVDPKCYDGMVKAAAVASLASTGKNPDAVISSIFDAFKEAGLVDGHLRARFINDVRTKLLNPEAEIADPVARQSTGSSLIEKVRNQGSSKSEGSELQSRSALEDGLDAPAEETSSQRKARLAAEAEAQATSDVNLYSDTLASLDPRQKQLADLYETLIKLLNEKTIPLDKIMEMDTSKLRGALAMRHKQGFDLFDQYEANDAAIAATREQIAALTDEIDASRSPRPENFKLAAKPQRKAAEALEKQVKSEDSRIASLSKKAQRANAKIEKVEGTLEENEGIATTFLYPATEQALEAPVVPAQPGFFTRLFSSKKTEEVQIEGAAAVEIEPGLEKPNTVSAQAQPEKGVVAPATGVPVEDGIPEPVVEAAPKPKWRFWG